MPFLRFDQRDRLLGQGASEWRLSAVSANDSRDLRSGSLHVLEDQETERLALTYRKGISNNSEFSIEAPYLSRGGGFMDPIITWWHQNMLHWQDPFRASQSNGHSVVTVPGATFGSASGLGDVSGYYKRRLTSGLDVEVGAKLPTGAPSKLLGSGGWDGGLALKSRRALGKGWHAYGMLGVVAQSSGSALPNVRGLVHQEGLALSWQPNSRDAWLAQWAGEASAMQTGVSGSDATHRQLTLGYRRQLSAGQSLELYFNEDRDVFNGKWPEGANIAPDWTIGATFTWKR